MLVTLLGVNILFNHHIKAVRRNGTLVLPVTPSGTNSCHPPSTSDSIYMYENTIIQGDEPSGPAPADGIGPMSERDPSAEMPLTPTSTTTFPIMASP